MPKPSARIITPNVGMMTMGLLGESYGQKPLTIIVLRIEDSGETSIKK
jgi:hypothetical protein